MIVGRRWRAARPRRSPAVCRHSRVAAAGPIELTQGRAASNAILPGAGQSAVPDVVVRLALPRWLGPGERDP